MSIKSLIKKFSLFMLSALLCLFILEICVRIFYPMPTPAFKYSPTLGSVPVPGGQFRHFDYWSDSKCFDISIRFNNQGLRGPCRKIPKEKDVFRIIFLGDSFTEGLQVKHENLFSTRLECLLNEKGIIRNKRVECVNLGLSGQGPAKHYVTLLEKGLVFEPDMVIEQLCINDFSEDDRYQGLEYNEDRSQFEITPENSVFIINFIKDNLRRRSQLYNAFVSLIKNKRRSWEEKGRNDWVLDVLAKGYFKKHDISNEQIKNTMTYIYAINSLCNSKDILHLVISFGIYPRFRPIEDYLDKWKSKSINLQSQYSKHPIYYELNMNKESNRIYIIDFTFALIKSEMNGKSTSFLSDGHFNSMGHKIVAREILNKLITINN